MKQTVEDDLHIGICTYLKLQYPEIVFTSESSGQYLGNSKIHKFRAWIMSQKRSHGKLADLWIMEPNRFCHGLFLEIKTKSPYLKNGEYSQIEHIQKQLQILKKLQSKGYFACFVWSFDEAKTVIDTYMNDRN